MWEFYGGLIKSFVFAWLTIIIACSAGLRVEGGAEGVGRPRRPPLCGPSSQHAGGERDTHGLLLLFTVSASPQVPQARDRKRTS